MQSTTHAMTEEERAVLIGHERASVRDLRKMLKAAFPRIQQYRLTSVIAQFLSEPLALAAMLIGLSCSAQSGCTVTHGPWSEWSPCGEPIVAGSTIGNLIGVHDALPLTWVDANGNTRKHQFRYRLPIEDCGLYPWRWQLDGRRCQ